MPLPLLAVGAGLSALSTLPNWYQSWKQSERADELAQGLKRPDFEIPQSEIDSLNSAKAQAGMTRLPGQSAIEGRLDQNTANEISDIQRMGTGGPNDINAAARAYGMQQENENKLGIEASNMYLRNQDILRNQLDQNAEWQQKEWEWDKKMPYENTAAAIGALRESSARNFDTGWKDLLGGGANLALGEYLRGQGGLDLGKTGGVNPSTFSLVTDPLQNGPTQTPISRGMAIDGNFYNGGPTNDQEIKIDRRPLFDAFTYGANFQPQFTSK
jgi:hypothetical protein